MCAILEQCEYLREHNNMEKPMKKGEAIALFESVGKELHKQRAILDKRFGEIKSILIVGLPLGFTILGLILK